MCVHRLDTGRAPACVTGLRLEAGGAMLFGDLNDPESAIAKAVGARASTQIRADLGLDPGIRTNTFDRNVERRNSAMAKLTFRKLDDHTPLMWGMVAVHAVLLACGLGAAFYMEVHGHIVTGMNNQIVWGMPHVFAVFLIVAASGALNVASISSVFNRPAYKPYARLSGILAISLLVGGLLVLVLDLGRPERFFVAMTLQ